MPLSSISLTGILVDTIHLIGTLYHMPLKSLRPRSGQYHLLFPTSQVYAKQNKIFLCHLIGFSNQVMFFLDPWVNCNLESKPIRRWIYWVDGKKLYTCVFKGHIYFLTCFPVHNKTVLYIITMWITIHDNGMLHLDSWSYSSSIFRGEEMYIQLYIECYTIVSLHIIHSQALLVGFAYQV